MSKKTEVKKLKLKRETIRTLTNTEMENVVGGGSYSQSNVLYNCHNGGGPKQQ